MEERFEQPVRWRIVFEGDVQFVGFRYTARLLAKRLSLSGWVKNLPDGRVESEVQGDVVHLRRFLVQLKSCPPIRITRCAITPIDPIADERRFSVKDYTE